MAANPIWVEHSFIKSSKTDFQKRLKISSFFEMMQDTASNHAEHLGFGYEGLLERGLAWVLSRKKVRFYDFPEMGETITMKTWPKGMQQKLFFMRDHEMIGADGRRLAAATSAYVLVSARTRRIAMPNTLDLHMPDNGGLSAIDETLEKIPAEENMSECFSLRAGYSAVDVMGHVNNARYIEWISDCFSFDDHRANRPAWLQINYLNEVLPEETVRMMRGKRGGDCGGNDCGGNNDCRGGWYLTGIHDSSGLKAFEAELHWQ